MLSYSPKQEYPLGAKHAWQHQGDADRGQSGGFLQSHAKFSKIARPQSGRAVSCDPWLFAHELHVEASKDLPFRLPVPLVGNRILRFEKGIVDGA